VARGCDERLATTVVAGLAGERLVSDERYIESLVHARRARGYGPQRIRRELEGKGIDRATIDQWIDPSDRDWLSDLNRVHGRKFGGRRPASLAERAKQTRFLQYRGYTPEQIRIVLGSDDDV
jgi:regulatory protein